MRPIELAARLLVGASRPLPEIVDAGVRRDVELSIHIPPEELGAVCTNEQWAELYDRLADDCRAHRSTLVFVSTRRMVERLALHRGERLNSESGRRIVSVRRVVGPPKHVCEEASRKNASDENLLQLCPLPPL